MFEPITLSVSDLAKRWQTTNRHILEMALSLRLPLYFFFDGLTLDVNDRWNQHGGDDLSARALIQSQEGPEALAEALEAREETRRKAAFNGSLRIPPQTILQLMNQGAGPAPGLAYAPSAPIELVDIGQQRGSKEPFLVWEGALLSLEPSQQACILTCENVFALANEVGAIEAQQTGEPRAETKERGHQKIIDATPHPVTTGDIAFAFDGLRWTELQWRKTLGNKPKWLAQCVAIPGQQGVSETRWNPVLIGAALVEKGVSQRSVRARFQTKPQLQPWLDSWRTHEATYLDTE